MRNDRENNDQSTLVNEHIRAPRVQLITHEGENLGVVPRDLALRVAREAGLDLVMLSEQGSEGVPVTKVMDFGKALYAKKKKMAEAKKHQKTLQIKELKFRPKIGEHDFKTKMNQAIQFLNAGKRLKITLVFRGREMVLREQHGQEMFDKISAALEAAGVTNVIQEKDSRAGKLWSRTFILKH
ncbi:translation initiation factor IF-3 [Candidatus Babeliales bacterium]|nr:translation initiation factor IF-3 [Candidatus Babeliales bacterium]